MAEVTGPIGTLPGTGHCLPEGTMCDCHRDRPAVRRVQGPTDSFGSEMLDLCQECIDENNKPDVGRCDWCKKEDQVLQPARDYDEGQGGAVYDVCASCKDAQRKRLKREAEREQYYDMY